MKKIAADKNYRMLKKAETLSRWTPEGLEKALLRGDTPRKPPGVSDSAFKLAIKRCTGQDLDTADGSSYCPYNYGVDKYQRQEASEKKDYRQNLLKLLKDPSEYKQAPRAKKKAPPVSTAWKKFQEIFPPREDGTCTGCDIIKAFDGSGANYLQKSDVKWVNKSLTKELRELGRLEESRVTMDKNTFLDIIANNRQDLFETMGNKRRVNKIHNAWASMNQEQKSFLKSLL
tara:strand:- start:572 stop:1261 length:690 start_codon:yes stop_codon:yes gene_type:complete